MKGDHRHLFLAHHSEHRDRPNRGCKFSSPKGPVRYHGGKKRSRSVFGGEGGVLRNLEGLGDSPSPTGPVEKQEWEPRAVRSCDFL